MNENRPNPRTATPEEKRALFSLMIVAGDMICFVVENKLGSAGVSIKLSEKGSVKQTNTCMNTRNIAGFCCCCCFVLFCFSCFCFALFCFCLLLLMLLLVSLYLNARFAFMVPQMVNR